MLKFLKAQFIIAVCLLVSMSVVYASEINGNLIEENNIKIEEKWRLPVGSKNVRYGTKYTIILSGEKYEYYLKYKEIVSKNENIVEAKFKGYYWGAKSNDLELDENYIYTKDKVKFTRNDVIEFLEIKNAKLAALIKEGYEFSLYLEPYYNYQKGKWSDIYTSTLRELYSMLPEANGEKVAYENAIDENKNLIKNKISGIEFLRETIVKSMNNLVASTDAVHNNFKNQYEGKIKDEMLNKGYAAFYFEEEKIKTGEFIKMITLALWPDFEYIPPEECVHPAKPYANALDRKVLMTVDYDYEKLEKVITRKEAARLLCLFYINYNKEFELNNTYEYLANFTDEALITEEIERICVDDAVRFGLMKTYEDGSFKPNNGLSKKEATDIFRNFNKQ